MTPGISWTLKAHSAWILVIAGFAVCGSAPASAKGIPVCAAETAATQGVDEGVNAAGDVAGDALGLLGLPVSDEGLQEQLNQVNANLAAMTGFLVTIADSTCETNNTLSNGADTSSIVPWSEGLDLEPSVSSIPQQVGGVTGVATSPMAKAVDLENRAVLTSAEAASDSEGTLMGKQSDGLKNMQGIALDNIGTDKLMLKDEKLQISKLKAASNITNLLAVEGVIQIAAVDALNRIDEGINQLSIDTAQIALNRENEEKVMQNDHAKTAKIFSAVP
jgi:type IV secretion system protein VirB5